MKTTRDWFDEANTLYESGKFLEADECLNEVFALDNKFMQAYRWKFKLFYSLGQYREMIKWCDKAIEIDPNYFFAYNSKGNAYRQLGRPIQALEAYNQAIAIDPVHPFPYTGKANVLGDMGRHQEALDAYNDGLKYNPENESALIGKALELEFFGRDEEAKEAYDKGLETNPRSTLCLCHRGKLLRRMGRQQEALEDFKAIKELIDSGFVDVNNNAQTRRFVSETLRAIEELNNVNIQNAPAITQREQNEPITQQIIGNRRQAREDNYLVPENIENNRDFDMNDGLKELESLRSKFMLMQKELKDIEK